MTNRISEIIVGTAGTNDRKNFIWNMLGSTVYSVASMLLSYLTIRIAGEVEGGIFSIALTLAQMFIYIAYFEMRTFQVTDVRDQFRFPDFYTTKWITCVAMMLVSAGYVWLQGYDGYKAQVVLLLCLYRMIDGVADVFESQFHKDGRLDLAGKSMTYRTGVSVAVYFVVLVMTKNLVYSLIAACVAAVFAAWLFDIYVYRFYGKISFTKDKGNIIKVLKACFPLFAGVFLWTYIMSASRLAIDHQMSSEYQAYYQVLFMPVSVINLCAGFIMRPLLLNMTECYKNGEVRKFLGMIGKVMAVLGGFTVLCMLGSLWIGPEVLAILAGCSLAQYRYLLVFLMFAGGFNAVTFVLYYALSIMEKKKAILWGYVFASLLSAVLAEKLVQWYGMEGGAVSYFVVISGLNIYFMVEVFRNLKKSGTKGGNDE